MSPGARAALDSFPVFAATFWPVVEPDRMVAGWHMRVVCKALQDVADGKIHKLCICIPPRHSKSLLSSVLWPAWLMAREPTVKILTSSHSRDLSLHFSRLHREIIRHPKFRRAYPRCRIKPGSDAVGSWWTSRGGRRISGSVKAKITGRGGKFMLIDDPHDLSDIDSVRAREDVAIWYRTTWLTRRDNAQTREVVIMQRSAADDLVGELTARYGFKVLAIPALATDDPPPTDITYDDPRKVGEALEPSRITAVELEGLRETMGRHFNAVYQQDPRPGGDGLFDRAWFTEPPDGWDTKVTGRVRYWDKAATVPEPGRDPDWTVGLRMARLAGEPTRYVIENLVRRRMRPFQTQALIVDTAHEDGMDVRVRVEQEPGSSGVEAVAHLGKALGGFAFGPDRKTGPKEERWNALSVQAEAGNVHLVKGPWNAPLLDELEALPDARHDDQADAAGGALAYLRRRRRRML